MSRKSRKAKRRKRKEARQPRSVSTTGEVLRSIEKQKRRKRVFILSAFVFILIATVFVVWYLASQPTPTGTLVIHVIDEYTGNPIGGATITISGPYEETVLQANEQGVHWFESVPVGTYEVSVQKTGYHGHTGIPAFPLEVDVEAGETTHRTIELHSHD